MRQQAGSTGRSSAAPLNSNVMLYLSCGDLLDGITYAKEDFWASEQSQEGISAGALDELLLAKNEHLLFVFNEFVKTNL